MHYVINQIKVLKVGYCFAQQQAQVTSDSGLTEPELPNHVNTSVCDDYPSSGHTNDIWLTVILVPL